MAAAAQRSANRGADLVDAVAAGGVTHEIDALRVDPALRGVDGDQAVEQPVDGGLVPHVPGIRRGPGGDVDPLGRLVEFYLVLPLTVVDSGWRAATAVHRNPKAVAARRFLAEHPLHPSQLRPVDFDHLRLEFRGVRRRRFIPDELPEPLASRLRPGQIQWRRRRHRRALRRRLADPVVERLEGSGVGRGSTRHEKQGG